MADGSPAGTSTSSSSTPLLWLHLLTGAARNDAVAAPARLVDLAGHLLTGAARNDAVAAPARLVNLAAHLLTGAERNDAVAARARLVDLAGRG